MLQDITTNALFDHWFLQFFCSPFPSINSKFFFDNMHKEGGSSSPFPLCPKHRPAGRKKGRGGLRAQTPDRRGGKCIEEGGWRWTWLTVFARVSETCGQQYPRNIVLIPHLFQVLITPSENGHILSSSPKTTKQQKTLLLAIVSSHRILFSLPTEATWPILRTGTPSQSVLIITSSPAP